MKVRIIILGKIENEKPLCHVSQKRAVRREAARFVLEGHNSGLKRCKFPLVLME
jgi:hypothetical protein